MLTENSRRPDHRPPPIPLITGDRRDEIRQRHHEDDLRDRARERREERGPGENYAI